MNRWFGRAAGVALLTVGTVATFIAATGNPAAVEEHRRYLDTRLAQEWAPTPPPSTTPSAPTGSPSQPAPPLAPGDPMARLYIPRLGLHWVVVEGVTEDVIRDAPGHFPESARPGEVGNFSVAGHRTRGTFWDLDILTPGDLIVAQSADRYYSYAVTELRIVVPTAIEVVAPVPGRPGLTPTEAMLTLTTCNPKWDNYERLIVHARLIGSSPTAPPDIV